VGGLADFDTLLELSRKSVDAQTHLALSAADMASFFTRESWTTPALQVLDRAIEVLEPVRAAECAYLRVTLMAREPPLGEDRLPWALEELVARGVARRNYLQIAGTERPVLEALDRLIAAARDASARLARGTLSREEVGRLLEEQPGRAYLPVTYP
jgi:hypothetical protein